MNCALSNQGFMLHSVLLLISIEAPGLGREAPCLLRASTPEDFRARDSVYLRDRVVVDGDLCKYIS